MIVGINHNNTSGTVDLMLKGTNDGRYWSESDNKYCYYYKYNNTNQLDLYVNSYSKYFTSDVQNAMQIISESDGYYGFIVNGKLVPPTITDVGLAYGNGETYEVFLPVVSFGPIDENKTHGCNPKSIISYNGKGLNYFTRTSYKDTFGQGSYYFYTACVRYNGEGYVSETWQSSLSGINFAMICRFGKK